jgi:DMSO/TMAO reductase YedYZ molybdopterin-dependent catalytic subunit
MNVLAPAPAAVYTRAPHVSVGGWVRQPLRLNVQALSDFEQVHVPDFVLVCTVDGVHGGARPLRGVRLRELVQAAGPAFKERTDFKRVAVVAESREGYRALFSWNELFNAPLGDGVIVAWDCAEAPLPPRAGPFVVVSLQDRATGPRCVQRLASVELHKLW